MTNEINDNISSIIIDSREKSMITKVSNYINKYEPNIDIDIKALPIGDYIICNTKYKYIIERKTLSDFYSSILNKRLENQLHRLETYEADRCILAITNFTFTKYIKPTVVYAMLASICQRYTIDVLFFKNDTQFIKFLTKLNKPPKSKLKIKPEYIIQPFIGDLKDIKNVDINITTNNIKRKKNSTINTKYFDININWCKSE